MRIAAFDLSLTGTGWATFTDGDVVKFGHFGFPLPKTATDGERIKRMEDIATNVLDLARGTDAVIFEDLSFGSNDPSAQERAGLAYMVRYSLWADHRAYRLVAPSTLKKFTFGKGNAKKEQMLLAVFERWGFRCETNDEADAIGLLHIELAMQGIWKPTIEPQREVVAALRAKDGL